MGTGGVSGRAAYLQARSRAVGALRGTVLEIGAGRTGSRHLLAEGTTWIALEPDPARAVRLPAGARAPLVARAEDIPLPDAGVDAVLSVHALCSVDDPGAVLREIARVLRPGGALTFAEHVAAAPGTAARGLQRVIAPFTRVLDHGCDPTRDLPGLLRDSPLRTVALDTFPVRGIGPFVVGRAMHRAYPNSA